jgi:hypothetical protein
LQGVLFRASQRWPAHRARRSVLLRIDHWMDGRLPGMSWRVLFVRNSHYQKAYQKSSRCTSGRCEGRGWRLGASSGYSSSATSTGMAKTSTGPMMKWCFGRFCALPNLDLLTLRVGLGVREWK